MLDGLGFFVFNVFVTSAASLSPFVRRRCNRELLLVFLLLLRLVVLIAYQFGADSGDLVWTEDEGHFLTGINYVAQRANARDWIGITDIGQVNRGVPGNLPNGTVTKILVGMLVFVLPQFTIETVFLIFNTMLLVGVTIVSSKYVRAKGRQPLAIYLYPFLFGASYYGSLMIKELLGGFLVVFGFYKIDHDKKGALQKLIVIVVISCLLFLERWYSVAFFVGPILAAITWRRGLGSRLIGFAVSIAFLIQLINLSAWDFTVLLRGYGAAQAGTFDTLPVPLKILFFPFFVFKFLISPFYTNALSEASGHGSWLFLPNIALQYALIFGLLGFFFLRKDSLRHLMARSRITALLNWVVILVFVAYPTLYNSTHGRFREYFFVAFLVWVDLRLPVSERPRYLMHYYPLFLVFIAWFTINVAERM